jgi:hypothetical protein
MGKDASIEIGIEQFGNALQYIKQHHHFTKTHQ